MFLHPAAIVGQIRVVVELVDPAFTLAVLTDESDNGVFEAAVDAGLLRAVIDQVASLTDTSARGW